MEEMNNIHDELHEAPFLKALRKQTHSDDLPEGYFDQFAERLNARLADAELAETAPTVFSASRKPYFRTPEGYFDALPGRIMARTRAGRVVSFLPSWVQAIPSQALAVAASVVLLIGIFFLQPDTPPVSPAINTLSSEELAEVVDWSSLDVDVIEAMYEEEIVAISESEDGYLSPDSELDPLLDELDAADIQHLILN